MSTKDRESGWNRDDAMRASEHTETAAGLERMRRSILARDHGPDSGT